MNISHLEECQRKVKIISVSHAKLGRVYLDGIAKFIGHNKDAYNNEILIFGENIDIDSISFTFCGFEFIFSFTIEYVAGRPYGKLKILNKMYENKYNSKEYDLVKYETVLEIHFNSNGDCTESAQVLSGLSIHDPESMYLTICGSLVSWFTANNPGYQVP